MSTKLIFIILAGCLLTGWLPLAQAAQTDQATTGENQKLLLFYGNDVRGEIEPCG